MGIGTMGILGIIGKRSEMGIRGILGVMTTRTHARGRVTNDKHTPARLCSVDILGNEKKEHIINRKTKN